MTQSVVSAYECGARQPSLPTLARIVSATGLELDVRVTEAERSVEPDQPLRRAVFGHRHQVQTVLARYGLRHPRVFGSVARGEERPGSDVDLLVEVPDGVGMIALARCQAELEQLFGAPVDLVPYDDLKVGVKAEALAEAVEL